MDFSRVRRRNAVREGEATVAEVEEEATVVAEVDIWVEAAVDLAAEEEVDITAEEVDIWAEEAEAQAVEVDPSEAVEVAARCLAVWLDTATGKPCVRSEIVVLGLSNPDPSWHR
jgi:hypothetical protein